MDFGDKKMLIIAGLAVAILLVGFPSYQKTTSSTTSREKEKALLRESITGGPSYQKASSTARENENTLFRESITDPWKRELYQRLDHIREICKTLCTLNSEQEIKAHQVDVPGAFFPMTVVPDMDCPALLSLEEIDAAGVNPIKDIPEELYPYYSLNGAVKIGMWKRGYLQSTYLQPGEEQKPLIWTREEIEGKKEEAIKGTLKGTYEIRIATGLREKLLTQRAKIQGKSLMVIGSEEPWVEAILLSLGAAKVTTLEYARIDSQHEQVDTLTPDEFRRKFQNYQGELFDGVVSYSSIEHSGLSRYGDALNPWGDLLAVARAWCVTKPGGFLSLNMPTGPDSIEFNAHRLYGRLRWSLVTANWKQVDTDTSSQEPDLDGLNYSSTVFFFEKVEPSSQVGSS